MGARGACEIIPVLRIADRWGNGYVSSPLLGLWSVGNEAALGFFLLSKHLKHLKGNLMEMFSFK